MDPEDLDTTDDEEVEKEEPVAVPDEDEQVQEDTDETLEKTTGEEPGTGETIGDIVNRSENRLRKPEDKQP